MFFTYQHKTQYCSECKDHAQSQRFHTLQQDSSEAVILY